MTTQHEAAAEAVIPWTASDDEFDDLWDSSPWASRQPDSVPDMLSTMFRQQRDHMAAYSNIGHEPVPPHLHGDLNNRQIQAAVREFASYTVEELYEAINHLKNKPWKQTDCDTDVEAFKEELADAWHFFIELHIIAGLDPIDVFRAYFQKAFINAHRQNSGY